MLPDLGQAAVGGRAEIEGGLSAGGGGSPGSGQELLRWPPGRVRGCGSARGRRPRCGYRPTAGPGAAPCGPPAPVRATPCLRRRCLGRAGRTRRPGLGAGRLGPRPWPGPHRPAAARGMAAPTVRRRRSRGCVGPRRRTSEPPRPCRPRSPPAVGAPRWVGRRRGCRRGQRTLLGARPGRRGCRRRPQGPGPRRPSPSRRRRTKPPAEGPPGRRPGAAAGSAPVRRRPAAGRRRQRLQGGPVGAAPTGAVPRCPSAARAAHAARSPTPGSRRRSPGAAGTAGRRRGRRSPVRSLSPPAPAGRHRPADELRARR